MNDTIHGRNEMRPFGELTTYVAALETALSLCTPILRTRRIPLLEAAGRIVADDVAAPVDVPSTDRAAMDGFAVIAADLEADGEVSLRPVGRVLAGELDATELASGHCWEVATGARLPHGADTVVPVEQTRTEHGLVVVTQKVAPGSHVSLRGEDLAEGDVIVAGGAAITPSVAAGLASIGVQEVDARRRPRVLLVPTGDELVSLDEEALPGQVYDSNSVGVQLLLEANGSRVERTPIVRDNAGALIEALTQESFDLVVTLGGTSVGRHDLVLDVVESLGNVLVHGIAIKPGKPVLVARVGDTPVLGLPGFPTSCLFTGYLFAEPMVRTLASLPLNHRRRQRAVLAEPVRSPVGKLHFLTVALDGDDALPVFRASSTITSMSRAEGWIEIAAEVSEVAAGCPVEVTFF